MPTECSPDFFGFEPVEGRAVIAAFDAGAITSDAGTTDLLVEIREATKLGPIAERRVLTVRLRRCAPFAGDTLEGLAAAVAEA